MKTKHNLVHVTVFHLVRCEQKMIKILTKDKSGQLLGIPHPVSHVAYISVKLYENIKCDSKNKKQTPNAHVANSLSNKT